MPAFREFLPPRGPVAGPAVFLAGPVVAAPDWQADAAAILRERAGKNGRAVHAANPRGQAVETVPGEELPGALLDPQAAWEQRAFETCFRSGAILFCFPPAAEKIPGRDYGRTTRTELGVWMARAQDRGQDNVIVLLDAKFQGAGYLRSVLASAFPRVRLLPETAFTPESLASAVETAASAAETRFYGSLN